MTDDIDSLVARLEEAAEKFKAVDEGTQYCRYALDEFRSQIGYLDILSLCAAFKAVKGVNEHLRDEVKTFLVLWAAQYSKIQMLGGAFHPQHFDRLKELGARMDDFRRAEVNSAKKDCSPIAEVTTPQYVKDAVRGAQVAPDEIG